MGSQKTSAHRETRTCNVSKADSLTAVSVNFNTGERIAKCIESVIDLPETARVIVSDNNSQSGDKKRLQQLASHHDKLLVLFNNANYGFSKGNNLALKYCNTPYIAFINPDSQVTQAAISTALDFMDSTPDVGMCGPLILNEDGSEQRGCRRDEPTPWKALKTLIGKREQGINQVGEPLPDHPVEVDAISGAFMLVRKEALDDVGPMDEGYFLHCEDLDWCKRFWQKGWKVIFVPDVTITHFKGGSSRKRPIRVEWHKHKGMVRYYHKFYRDKYPKPFMYLVYTAVWARFFLMTPIWWLKGLRA